MRQTRTTETESKAATVLRLLRQGGYVLVVGGETSSLPDRVKNHSQVLIWDDNIQSGLEHKTVPTNTRAILTSRWISHGVMWRCRQAAERLRIPIFPMQRTAELKALLAEFVPDEVVRQEPSDVVEIPPAPVEETKPFLTKEDTMKAAKTGEMKAFILQHAKESDYAERGSIAAEARRLIPLANAAGFKTTEGAMQQAIRAYRKNPSAVAPKTTKSTSEPRGVLDANADDFVEAEKLLRDARAAIDLFLDFLPKLRKEVTSMRKRQEALKRTLLGGD